MVHRYPWLNALLFNVQSSRFSFLMFTVISERLLWTESKDNWHGRGIATTYSTPYHTTGNSQRERCSQAVWKIVPLNAERSNSARICGSLFCWALSTRLCYVNYSNKCRTAWEVRPLSRRSMLGHSLLSRIITLGQGCATFFVGGPYNQFQTSRCAARKI